MRILHIASFVGNIGDNLSHIGLRSVLDEIFGDYYIDTLEIRKFYKNYIGQDKYRFDEKFLTKIEDYDLCIIGGGGFLDYWVEGSESGTTIDIKPDLIPRIKTPVLICSVGCIPHRDVPEGNEDKFKLFLERCSDNSCIEILLRNDGSFENVEKKLGFSFTKGLVQSIDNAFFIKDTFEPVLPVPSDYVAINLSGDQLLMNSELMEPIDVDSYYEQMATVVSYICVEESTNVVFVPHIYSDLAAISRVLNLLDDFVIRTKVSVAPCIQFDAGAKTAASIYQNASLSIGMRFHANVIPLALGRKSIGLVALDRVKHMYDSIGMDESYVLVTGKFSTTLCSKISEALGFEEPRSSTLNLLRDSGVNLYVEALERIGLGHALKARIS